MSSPSQSSGPEAVRAAPREEAKHPVPRRRVLHWFLGTSLGALFASVAYPVLRFVNPPEVPEAATHQIDIGREDDPEFFSPGFKIVRFGAEPVIVIRVGEADFRAFAATCTHLDCIVEYRPGERKLWCNCHDGQYDLDGRNIAGPPPRPLERYTVHRVDTDSGPASLVIERS